MNQLNMSVRDDNIGEAVGKHESLHANIANISFETSGDKGINSYFDMNAINNVNNDSLSDISGMYGDYSDFVLDYGSIPYPGEIKQVPLWEQAMKITVYSVIILLSLVGNILIIVVVARHKRMRTTTNFYIVNLAVSDLLVTIMCTWVHLVNNLTEGWMLGAFFCKANSFAQVTALLASILSLVLIACDRFFGIVFAMKAHIIERRASHSIVLIWLCAIAFATPLLFVRTTESVTWLDHVEIFCHDDWPFKVTVDSETGLDVRTFPSRVAYYTVLTVVLYFLPIVCMSCIYLLIIVTVWFARVPGETISGKEIKVQRRVKRKVVKMLVIILATFGICWLPLQISILYTELRPDKTVMLPDWYSGLEFFSYTLAFSNSAINPLIYAGFNENFRKGFRSLFGCYERKLYAAISKVDSMYNSSTTMTRV